MTHSVSVEGHRLIRAPLQRVWHLLSRLESHPRYVTLWMAADVHERSPTSALVEFRGFFGGLPIASAQRITLRPPTRLEFRQVRGELRELTGAYVLKEVDGETDVSIQLSIDADILLFPDASVQQIIVGHIDGTLGRIKASAERDLVRLTPRRARAPDVTSAAAATAESEPSAAHGVGPDLAAPESRPPGHAIAQPEARGSPARTGGRPLRSPSGPPAATPASERGPQRLDGRRRRRRRRRGRGGGRVPSGEGGGPAPP
ncbi:MAG TPA: SRPBCC family protein [bacterium]|nr:SRPBCC family protein [bacterium]